MAPEITHNRSVQRFETTVEGARCVLDYRLAGDRMTITHTGVPASVGGRGIASALVHKAMETAREQEWTVAPACSYAATWMERHPEYEDLRG